MEWPTVAADTIAYAKKQSLVALANDGPIPVGERLAAYYDVDGDYVGASFAKLAPNEWHDVTGTDVLAVLLMHGKIGPRATRRLRSGADRTWVLDALGNLPAHDLLTAGPDTLEAMEDFYLAVKSALSSPTAANSNPWVSASKLCARKRPDLFPVRDRNVCLHLGILGLNDFRADWQVFRALIQDDDIRRAIESLPSAGQAAAGDRQLELDDSCLRLLDAALWTYSVWDLAETENSPSESRV